MTDPAANRGAAAEASGASIGGEDEKQPNVQQDGTSPWPLNGVPASSWVPLVQIGLPKASSIGWPAIAAPTQAVRKVWTTRSATAREAAADLFVSANIFNGTLSAANW